MDLKKCQKRVPPQDQNFDLENRICLWFEHFGGEKSLFSEKSINPQLFSFLIFFIINVSEEFSLSVSFFHQNVYRTMFFLNILLWIWAKSFHYLPCRVKQFLDLWVCICCFFFKTKRLLSCSSFSVCFCFCFTLSFVYYYCF
jgi:hypothetical protein